MSSRVPFIDSAYRDTDSRAPALRLVLFIAFLIAGAVYFCWRVTVFNPSAPVASTVFFVVELLGFLNATLICFISQKRRSRTPIAPSMGIAVDVFITTYDEHIDIVRRTLAAAVCIRYPHETWLLDDGNRPEFRALAEEFGCRYLARLSNVHAKAGNLNNGLAHARGEFILLLDADHCADPDILTRVLGYFQDPWVAFVQTPQDFFNFDSFQHGRDKSAALIWHEQSRFNHVEQTGRDHHGSTLMCGCSCVIRRAALDSVAGFAVGTVTEDMHTAVRMMKRGWKPAYHDEPLAFGIAPPDFTAFTRQRLRWAEGNLQVCRIERLPFARGIGWRANLSYALLTIYYVDSWRKLVLYAAPPLSLLTNVPPVYGEPIDFWLYFFPFFFFSVITFKEFSSGFGRAWRSEVDSMALMTAGLPSISGIFRSNIRFRVTPKTADGRFQPLLLLPQIAVLATGAAAIAYFAIRHWQIHLGYWPDEGIPLGIASILAVLTGWNCLVAGVVIRRVWRAARPSPINVSHAVPLPIQLRAPGMSRLVVSRTISVDEINLADDGIPTGPHAPIEVEIFLPSGSVRAQAHVKRSAHPNIRLVLQWQHITERDRLDYALHAGRWHRIVCGHHEMVRTPFEWLGFLEAPPGRMPASRPRWQPVLVYPLHGKQGHIQLGYALRATPEEPATEIILFSALELPFWIKGADGSEVGPYEIAGPASRPQLDEGALRSVGGHRHALRIHRTAVQDRRRTAVEFAD